MVALGDGIAIAGVCILLTSAIMKFVPSKNGVVKREDLEKAHDRISDKISRPDCVEHRAVINKDISLLRGDVIEIKRDVKTLLMRNNGSI